MSPQRITLRIDRVSVSGAHPSRAALARAMEGELAQLLAEPGAAEALRGGGAVERLDAGRAVPEGPGEAALGAAVARATMGALKR